jgi:hypothetical protein
VSNLGKFSNALAGLFDDYDSSPGQCICTISDDLRKSLNNERCTSISQTEEDHSGLSTLRKGHYFAEVKIKCDDHARLGDRLIENLAVGQALQSFVSEVGRVVSLRVQPRRNEHIHAHVIEKTHVQTLAKVNLFLGQPSGIFNRLLDIFPFQIRVALKNFLKRRSMRDLAHNYGDRYAHSAYACSPAHDLGVKGDSVEHNQSPPDFGSYPRAARRRLGYNAFTTIAKRWKFCAVIVSPVLPVCRSVD